MLCYNISERQRHDPLLFDPAAISRHRHVSRLVGASPSDAGGGARPAALARGVVGDRAVTDLLTFSNVTLSYDRHAAVHHLSGSVRDGSMTAIIGPNGAGKTSLLKAVLGLIPHREGRIDSALKRRDIAYLPQHADIDRRFPITVVDAVQIGLWSVTGAFGAVGRRGRERVIAALAAVGLAGFENRQLASLSSGQFQRVLFARLLVQDARLILLDEPFAAVDARTTADLLALLANWHDEGRTIVSVLHDYDQVRRHFPETLLLAREAVAWGPTAEALAPANLNRARSMAEAWDESAPICERSVA
jgi:zinc/manganese transport system ATP-binding protein